MQGLYLVLTAAREGRESEYHAWYENRHIPDLLAVPGVSFARRFAVTPAIADGPAAVLPFAAFYGFANVDEAVEGILERRGTDRLVSSNAVARSLTRSGVFELLEAEGRRLCANPTLALALWRQATPDSSCAAVGLRPACDGLVAKACAVQAALQVPWQQMSVRRPEAVAAWRSLPSAEARLNSIGDLHMADMQSRA